MSGEDIQLVTTYISKRRDIEVQELFKRYKDGRLCFNDFQRFDGWSDNYKQVFIRSLLENKDIPKIYTSTPPDEEGDDSDDEDEDNRKAYILDGGHRTRAIVEYMSGGFGIRLNDGNWYFYKTVKKTGREGATSQNRKLPKKLREGLRESPIQIVNYRDLTEIDSRKIFNELNHQRAMTKYEIVNAHSSRLVEFIRDLSKPDEDGNCLVDVLVSLVPKFKKENHEFYRFMIAMFSITELPTGESHKYCEPSSLLKYVKGDGEIDEKRKPTHNTQFTESDMEVLGENYKESIGRFKDVLEKITPTIVNDMGDAYSIFQYVHYKKSTGTAELSSRVKSFMDTVGEYRSLANPIVKIIENTSSASALVSEKKKELLKLREKTGQNVVDWVATTQNNPCGAKNMKIRYDIMVKVFV